MARLEDLRENARVRGLVPEGVVTIQRIDWIGDQAVQVLHSDSSGRLGQRLVFRDDEPNLEVVTTGRPGPSTPTATSCASSPKHGASGWRGSSTPTSRSPRPASSRCLTRSARSMVRC